ncbi:hypothetical protein ABMA27_001367 [Loxostege sticticalis]|uniref:FLYWCH-type domain-containing protein n=1 Tax=Loxostege sticticalis TaxID=481309 RepID=A0ABR3HY80_LOXSC
MIDKRILVCSKSLKIKSFDFVLTYQGVTNCVFVLGSIQIVMSKRGKPLLCVDGYTYFKERTTSKGKTRWCCSTHVPRGCRATIHTTDTEIIRTNTVHNHKPNNSIGK